MIDFHNHILPGADDGAKDINESIAMIESAHMQGITDIVNTIHFQHPKMEGLDTSYEYVKSLRTLLCKELQTKKIEIDIHLGAEVYFNFNLLDLVDNPLLTFENGKYMLIEFQTYQFPKGYENHLYDLAMKGVTPIIAHPERYKPIQDDISIIASLINSGCLIQVDCGSLLGSFGKKCRLTSEKLFQRNMVHLLGSDAHNSRNRNFCLKNAYLKLKNLIDKRQYDIIKENPFKVIKGEPILPFDILDIKENIFSRFFNYFSYK